MRQYGLPYKGSKQRLAERLLEVLPSGRYFIDLFAGGCAMTHAAMLSGKYKSFIANDINDIPRLFIDAVHGKYRNESRWISRDEFLKKKDSDPYISCVWSFGSDLKSYLYGRDIEPYKKALHYAVFFDDWKDFRSLLPEVYKAARESMYGRKKTGDTLSLQVGQKALTLRQSSHSSASSH